VSENVLGSARKPTPARVGPAVARVPAPPADPRGAAATGRIAKLLVGQGHGFIKLADGREVFFHRSDVRAGLSINELSIGDPVAFELLEDAVSGDRALRVRRHLRRR
jgi:cold shock CspA family protein